MPFTTFKYSTGNSRFELTAPVQVSGHLIVNSSGDFGGDVTGDSFGSIDELSGQYYAHEADVANPHEATFTQVRTEEGGSDVTLVELEELTDGSLTALHTHAGGGADTLDTVCDRGNETNQDIHSSGTITADADLQAGGDVHINYDVDAGDPTMYFHFE